MKEDLTGHIFGTLKVISSANGYKNGRLWNCKCFCGNSHIVNTSNLKLGRVKSCGCLRIENMKHTRVKIPPNKLDYGISMAKELFNSYSRQATKRKYSFKLSFEEFKTLSEMNCYYCGIMPTQIRKARKYHNGHYIYNGIDRVNNKIGYEFSNCVSCCKKCNVSKAAYSKEDFLKWVENVYYHSIKKDEKN